MAAVPQTCADCSKPLCANNRSGFCRRHTAARIMSSPETCAKVSRSRRLMFLADPEKHEAQVRRMRAAQSTPHARAARRAHMIGNKLWTMGNAAIPAGSEPRMRAGAKTRAAKAVKAGVPPHMIWRRSVGVETPAPVVLKPLVLGDFIDRAASVAAQWAGVRDIWSADRTERLVRARWSVFLALHRQDYSQSRIARDTGLDRSTVRHGLPRAQALSAEPGEFADLFAMVMAA